MICRRKSTGKPLDQSVKFKNARANTEVNSLALSQEGREVKTDEEAEKVAQKVFGWI